MCIFRFSVIFRKQLLKTSAAFFRVTTVPHTLNEEGIGLDLSLCPITLLTIFQVVLILFSDFSIRCL
jgi:hypothetical protein